MTASHPPYAQPQPEPQLQRLTKDDAAKLRGYASAIDRNRQEMLLQRDKNEQAMLALKKENESLAIVCGELDATAGRFRALVREAGHPEEEPGAQWEGPPATGTFQSPEPPNGRASQARDQMPAAAREGK